jgi:predicted MFS family arabinose efflux permease
MDASDSNSYPQTISNDEKKHDLQAEDPAPTVQSGEMTPIAQTNPSTTDPKTWSRPRKEMAFAVIVFGSCACGAIGPLLVPGFATVAADLGVTLTQVTLLNGSLVMALGVSAYVANALATAYGTRLIFLATTLALVATCCWGAAARSYGSLLAARIFQGRVSC